MRNIYAAAVTAAGLATAALGFTAGPVAGIPQAASARPVVGVYVGAPGGGGLTAPEKVRNFEAWFGRSVEVVTDFEASDTWDNIAGADWQLAPWRDADRRLVLTVPMLPGPWDRTGPRTGTGAGVPVSLAACGRGRYDPYWAGLAADLVAFGFDDAILRVGHEFNGGWYAWRASGREADYAKCFRRVVAVMRTQPSQAFRFVWNPVYGYQQFAAERAYPGDASVDYVGLDIYDEAWGPDGSTVPDPMVRWRDYTYGGHHGLRFWRDFAAAHDKPLALPEWGVTIRPRPTAPGETEEQKLAAFFADPRSNGDGHGGGDNPYFVEQMHAFISDPANNVAFTSYFEFNAVDGVHALANVGTPFPQSATRFRELIGAVPEASATVASASATPTMIASAEPPPAPPIPAQPPAAPPPAAPSPARRPAGGSQQLLE